MCAQADSCRGDDSEELEGAFPVEVDDAGRSPQRTGESERKKQGKRARKHPTDDRP